MFVIVYEDHIVSCCSVNLNQYYVMIGCLVKHVVWRV